jgi:nucleotide-binding universal stress UspA family protein
MAPDHAVCSSSAVRGIASPHRLRKGGEEMSIFPTKVLLATDGSRDAELARTTAVDMANSTNSELHVVTVAPGRPSYDVRNPEVVEHLRRDAEEILNEQAAKIEQEGGKVAEKYLRIAERYRAQQIVKVAEDIGAGLIVMGSRGLGGVRRALMGSVSDSVVRHAHCPVLVVRPEKEQVA